MSAHRTASSGSPGQAPLHFVHPRQFKANTQQAVDDPLLRKNFRSAMDFLQNKRSGHFSDRIEFEKLRQVGEAIRRYSLSRLPDLLEQLEHKLTDRGVQVHWASNAEEANASTPPTARSAPRSARPSRNSAAPRDPFTSPPTPLGA